MSRGPVTRCPSCHAVRLVPSGCRCPANVRRWQQRMRTFATTPPQGVYDSTATYTRETWWERRDGWGTYMVGAVSADAIEAERALLGARVMPAWGTFPDRPTFPQPSQE